MATAKKKQEQAEDMEGISDLEDDDSCSESSKHHMSMLGDSDSPDFTKLQT